MLKNLGILPLMKDLEAIPLDIDFNPLNWDFEVSEVIRPTELSFVNWTMGVVDYEIDEETVKEVGEAIEGLEFKDAYHY